MKLSILKSLLTLGVTKEDAQKYIVLLEKREEKRRWLFRLIFRYYLWKISGLLGKLGMGFGKKQKITKR